MSRAKEEIVTKEGKSATIRNDGAERKLNAVKLEDRKTAS
jgi:hypothetical protein